MDKYEKLKQEMYRQVVHKQIDALGLCDFIIELHKQLDEQNKTIAELKEKLENE